MLFKHRWMMVVVSLLVILGAFFGATVAAYFLGGLAESWFEGGSHLTNILILVLVFVMIWIRWTLPRLRVDQVMVLGYKYLTPLALLCVLGAATYELLAGPRFEERPLALQLLTPALVLLGGAALVLALRRQAAASAAAGRFPNTAPLAR